MRGAGFILFIFCAAALTGLSAEDFSAIQTRFFPPVNQAVDVELSRFGSFTAVADWTEGNSVSVFDENGELLWRHRQPIYWGGTLRRPAVLQFAGDESFLIFPAFRTDNDVAVVDPKTGKPLAVLTEHSHTVSCLALSADATRLVTHASGELFLWQRNETGFRLSDAQRGAGPAVTALAFSARGYQVAAGMTDRMSRHVVIYDASGAQLKEEYRFSLPENNLSHEFTQVAFSPDGMWLAAGYGDRLMIWRLGSGGSGSQVARPVQTVEGIELGSVLSLTFAPDSLSLFTGHPRDVRMYALSGGRWIRHATFTPHQGLVRDIELSPDGTLLAVAGRSESNALGYWSVTGVGASPFGKLLRLLDGEVSTAQRTHLTDTLAAAILAAVPEADKAPRDMFETTAEYNARTARARLQALLSLQKETEKAYNATHTSEDGSSYLVLLRLQTQGSYNADSATYRFKFMDQEAVVTLARDRARELYTNWMDARVTANRLVTPDGPTYADFRLSLPSWEESAPVGLTENPFTGEQMDRFGVHVPAVLVGKDLQLRSLTLDGVFPSLYPYYVQHSLGTFELYNSGSRLVTDISVKLNVPGLMKTPTPADAPVSLGVGQHQSVSLLSLFDPRALGAGSGTSVSAEISVEYRTDGELHRELIPVPIQVLNRNAISWSDDRKVAAFMYSEDPALLKFSAGVIGMADNTPAAALTGNLLYAIRLFEAVTAAGVNYVVDPTSPYDAVSRDRNALDFVRFPAETLDQRGGDCDDLSVLLATLLESVGVKTAYITTPGHILMAFDLGLEPASAQRLFGNEPNLILRDGTTWMPIETTLLDSGFTAAWQEGAATWKRAHERGTGGFFPTAKAWALYPPAAFTGPESVPLPPQEKVVSSYHREIDEWRSNAMRSRENALRARLETQPGAETENLMGILYAQFGRYPDALRRFERALGEKEYLPALINAASVLTLRNDFEGAETYLERALRIDPDNARILLGLAVTYFETGQRDQARAAFERASRISPSLANRYPLPVSSEATQMTAPSGNASGSRSGRYSVTDELLTTEWRE